MLSFSIFFFVDAMETFIYKTTPSVFILKDQKQRNNRGMEEKKIYEANNDYFFVVRLQMIFLFFFCLSIFSKSTSSFETFKIRRCI